MPVALVLSAGGLLCPFEVGAVRYLYEHGIVPDIICATSGGSLNAAVLAERGKNAEPMKAVEKLERGWLSLQLNTDMYVEEPWFAKAVSLVPQFKEDVTTLAGAPPLWSAFNIAVYYFTALARPGYECFSLAQTAQDALASMSCFNLLPTIRRLQSADTSVGLVPSAVRSSGIKLRIATVNLGTGELRYITEAGQVLDRNGRLATGHQVDLVGAVIASASIPGYFPPTNVNGEDFVDGGVREFVPVQAAVGLGADRIFVVRTHKTGVDQIRAKGTERLADILPQAMAIMIDEIQENDTNPPYGWGASVSLTEIQPTISLPSTLDVDPGRIATLMDYGYMRADDVITNHIAEPPVPLPAVNPTVWQLADLITQQRLDICQYERDWATQYVPVKGGLQRVPSASDVQEVRRMKKQLCYLADARLCGQGALPTKPIPFETWWETWERHNYQVLDLDLWGRFEFPDATVIDAESAPSLPSGLRMFVELAPRTRAGKATSFTVRMADELCRPVAGKAFVDGNVSAFDTNVLIANYTFHSESHRVRVVAPGFPETAYLFSVRIGDLRVSVETPPIGVLSTVTVHARDEDDNPVPNLRIAIQDPAHREGDPDPTPNPPMTESAFTYLFRTRLIRSGEGVHLVSATGSVTGAPDYHSTDFEFFPQPAE